MVVNLKNPLSGSRSGQQLGPQRKGRAALPGALDQSARLGPEWLIETKHDGFRVIARKKGKRVRL